MGYRKEFINKLIKEGDFYVTGYYDNSTAPLSECVAEAIEAIRYIPEDALNNVLSNIETIISKLDTNKPISLDTLLSKAAALGFLTFKPYCTNHDGYPMLVLQYNKYVHLFRGYYFTCSYNPDAIGTYRESSVRLHELYDLFCSYGIRDSKLFGILCYMNLVNCCSGIGSFDKLLRNDPSVIDEFVKESVHMHYSVNIKIKYEDILEVLSSGITSESIKAIDQVYRIPASQTQDYCRFGYNDKGEVCVTYVKDSKVVARALKLPTDDITSRLDSETIENAILSSLNVKRSLVCFALNSLGYIVNYMSAYPLHKDSAVPINASNRVDSIVFKNLRVLG